MPSMNLIMDKPIWEGIYSSFKDAPAKGDSFNSDRWIGNSRKKLFELIEASRSNKTIPTTIGYKTNLLPILAAIVSATLNKVQILDFGGGIGITYFQVISALEDDKNLEYHIVENEKLCKAGRKSFKNDHRVQFHSSLPDIEKFDIVQICSVVQYIEDWKSLIEKLAGYKPLYFMFNDLIAGDIPSYVTIQNYYESKIPVWFLNIKEVIEVMTGLGFKLFFKSRYLATILGEEMEIPQHNFPPEYRVGHSCNLLFKLCK